MKSPPMKDGEPDGSPWQKFKLERCSWNLWHHRSCVKGEQSLLLPVAEEVAQSPKVVAQPTSQEKEHNSEH